MLLLRTESQARVHRRWGCCRRMAILQAPLMLPLQFSRVPLQRLTNISVRRRHRQPGFPSPRPSLPPEPTAVCRRRDTLHPPLSHADLRSSRPGAGLRPGPASRHPRPDRLASGALWGGPTAPAAMQNYGGASGAKRGCGDSMWEGRHRRRRRSARFKCRPHLI